jgi:hypothetical protein
MEKQLQIINTFLGTSFTTMPEALLVIDSLQTSNLEKYQALQLLLQEPEDELSKKQLQTINRYLLTSFATIAEALTVLESLKTTDLLKYQAIQILLQRDAKELEKPEDEKNEPTDKPVVLPESVRVNALKWQKSLKSSQNRKGFPTLTGVAKDLEGLENFQNFNVQGVEVRVTEASPTDTKLDSYLGICFVYDEKLVKCKIPMSKLASVESEILEGLPFQFATCEYIEAVIDGAEVNYIKYSFGPM